MEGSPSEQVLPIRQDFLLTPPEDSLIQQGFPPTLDFRIPQDSPTHQEDSHIPLASHIQAGSHTPRGSHIQDTHIPLASHTQEEDFPIQLASHTQADHSHTHQASLHSQAAAFLSPLVSQHSLLEGSAQVLPQLHSQASRAPEGDRPPLLEIQCRSGSLGSRFQPRRKPLPGHRGRLLARVAAAQVEETIVT